MKDPFDLNRFVQAQNPVYDQVLEELAAGRKTGHWMWFIFPQLAGLGSSPTARKFAISGWEEARIYVGDCLLGGRLKDCTRLVNAVEGRSIERIFGYPDHLKFHSSMTLFHEVRPDLPEFSLALEKYFDGEPDQRTLGLLASLEAEVGP